MPTYNRAFCICNAIDSALASTYPAFELIIVDDGSTDNTIKMLNQRYSKEIKSQKIRIFQTKHTGVCHARNAGLQNAKYDWIGYLDSDNRLRPYTYGMFANCIINNRNALAFYGKMHALYKDVIVGHSFDLNMLKTCNFIDLGTYVHHKSLYEKHNGFDENMTKLVDWELILRYSIASTPVFCNFVVLDYNDSTQFKRITTTESDRLNKKYIFDKHRLIRQ